MAGAFLARLYALRALAVFTGVGLVLIGPAVLAVGAFLIIFKTQGFRMF